MGIIEKIPTSALIVTGVAFLLLGAVIQIPWFLALGPSLVFGGATWWFAAERPRRVIWAGVSREEGEKVLREARGKIAEIRGAANNIRKESVKRDLWELCEKAELILSDLASDPRPISTVKLVLMWTLEGVAEAFARYNDLSLKNVPEARAALEETELFLPEASGYLNQIYSGLQVDDINSLRAVMTNARKSLELQGMQREERK